MECEVNLIKKLENDEFYSKFLEETTPHSDFTKYMAISDQVKKLNEGIELIKKELQKSVLEKHEDLLKQSNHATKLESILNVMNLHVSNLVANAERLKTQINVPYENLEKNTKVLGRLHLASHILRQVSRIQQLGKRLQNTHDPSQKALILQELEQLASDDNLKEIDVVTSELRNVRAQQQKLVQMANASLNQGVKNEKTTQITSALQIFINLGTISQVLDDFISTTLSDCKQSLKSAFESSNVSSKIKGGSTKNSLTTTQGFRTKLWGEIEKTFSEDLLQQCKEVKFLQSVLTNMNLHEPMNVAGKFWDEFGAMVKEQIKTSPSSVQQMLNENYPRFLQFYVELTKKLNYTLFNFDRSVLEKCETAYLSSSLTVLMEPTQEIFTKENNVPSHDDIDKIIRIISSNLSEALVEENLSEKMARNISKCIKMFAVKTEQQLETGPDSAQVIGGNANLGQQKNVQLANCLYYFQTQIQRIFSNMKESLAGSKIDIIYETFKELDALSGAIIQPLVVSINSAIETIIVTIHLESDWTKVGGGSSNKQISCSPYMRELTQFINRVFNTYLKQFENTQVLLTKCREITERCIELFVRHTILLRPATQISQNGRMRLKADYTQLEVALKTLTPNLSELGRPYKLFKAMSSLITLNPEEIIGNYTAGSVVPPSTILFLLFSHAGAKLASPHQNTGWSLAKLSAWMDEHKNEPEGLDLIAGALQRYEALIRQKNLVNYDPIYPLMSNFLQKVMKT